MSKINKRKIDRILRGNATLVGVFVLIIVATIFVRGFASMYNLRTVIAMISPLAVLSCGVTLPVLNGGNDMSSAAMVTLGSVLSAYLTVKTPLGNSTAGVYAALLMICALGVLIGMFNGMAVIVLKMPSFIATMAMQMILSGSAVLFASVYYEKTSLTGLPASYMALGGGSEYSLLTPLIIMLTIVVFTQWLLTCTAFGRRVYAVGTNQRAAYVSGVKTKKLIFTLMTMSGLYAAIASILYTAKNQAGIPSIGDPLFTNVMTSIIVGGTSVNGGGGGVHKTLYGVLFIIIMDNALNLKGVTWYAIILIKGLIMLTLISLATLTIPVPKFLRPHAADTTV